MASSWRGEKTQIQITKKKTKKNRDSVSVQRRPVFSSSHLRTHLRNEKSKTRVSSDSAISKVWSLISTENTRGSGAAREQAPVPSSVRCPQTGGERLSMKQKAKQGHRKAHPGGEVFSLMPPELQNREKKIINVELLTT